MKIWKRPSFYENWARRNGDKQSWSSDKNSDLEDKVEELYREISHIEQLGQEIENLKCDNL